ncbi:MAG: D-2-hydroxyacid dehydrogenase [Clostridiales bacterium]|nr:D-2-hydroxyacid dehydrogenase [Clostridiales bacterium]
MPTVLVSMPVRDAHRRQITEAVPDCDVVFELHPTDEQIFSANAVVGNVALDRLERADALELVQLNSAGVGSYVDLLKGESNVRVCSATGAYGLAIAEHMFGVLLAIMKRLNGYRDQQRSGEWKDLGGVTSVYGARVLVIGLGNIGCEFAKRCNAFGAQVIGITRSRRKTPSFCEQTYTMEEIDAQIPEADVVFLSVPETKETIRLMSHERISRMKQGSILLNCGRGSAVDTDALVDALNCGCLFGAGLDVTDPEPLPPEHPLWQCENALITPHVSGGYHLPVTHDRIVEIACQNLRAWREGKTLRNLVDAERGY